MPPEELDPIEVLVVDDDIDFRRMAQESLRHHGFDVKTVGTAADAIRCVSSRVFDVVVTDLVLDATSTVESSVDLIERLKRYSPSTQVIVLSGYAATFKEQLAALRVPVLEKGAAAVDELEHWIRRMVVQKPRVVSTDMMSVRLEDIRRILAEELPKIVATERRTMLLEGDVRVDLPKPLQGFKHQLERKLAACPYRHNVFLMMKFRDNNRDISEFMVEVLRDHGFRGIRADDEGWNLTGNVYNPIAVLHCCKYGIALFDQLEPVQAYSANVAYELGMMHQQQKNCLILRHSSLPAMPFDLLKDLYVVYERELQLRNIIKRWVADLPGLE